MTGKILVGNALMIKHIKEVGLNNFMLQIRSVMREMQAEEKNAVVAMQYRVLRCELEDAYDLIFSINEGGTSGNGN